MNLDQLTSLLAAGVSVDPGRSPGCPDEHEIAGYVDGGLTAAARDQVGLHLADCSHCLALVALLCRGRDVDAVAPVVAANLEQARAAGTSRQPHRWRPAPQWAAAAVLVLAVPLLVLIGRNPDRGAEGQGRPALVQPRNLPAGAAGLRVLEPREGSSVDARRLAFRWTEVPGTPYYDVRIVNDVGDVVIEQQVSGTTWQLPAHLYLQPGAEYFVHVDAYPSGDKATSSEHVPFRVSE